MKQHPILFSSPMILALRAGRKHVTRRLSKQWMKVKAGDRLAVRETHIILECEEDARLERLQDITEEDAVLEGCEECRITEADIREAIENPMDESMAMMVAFGPGIITAKADYAMLWDDLHTKPGERFADNPEVVRVGRFHVIEGLGQMAAEAAESDGLS